jgi:uncharacterized protein HemY
LKYNSAIVFWSMFIISTSFILFVAWLVDKFVDKPCIRFSAWLGKRLTQAIQDRTEAARNMAAPVFRKVKGLITRVRYKHRHSQNSWALIQAIEEADKSVPASEQNENHIEKDNQDG